jgi:hypothetical protein
MIPAPYQLYAAGLLVIAGLVSCVAGYRLFRWVLGLFGFMLGALAVSAIFGASDRLYMVAAAVGGGLAGALLMLAAYFVGVALVGAAVGAVAINLMWKLMTGEPHPYAVVLFAVGGAVLATWLQRYVIITATAFAGGWTLLVGALALIGDRTRMNAAATGDVWVLYPLQPAPGQAWVPWAWIALGLAGALIQAFVTGGDSGRVVKRKK